MKLQPNIGSDRSWVWKVAADYAETPATSETLAIRFANSDSQWPDLIIKAISHTYLRCRTVQGGVREGSDHERVSDGPET